MRRTTQAFLACLCLAACKGEPQPEAQPPAAPAKSAEQRAIDRRLRQAGDARRDDAKAARDKALRDAMHTPVDTFQRQRVP